MDTPDQTILFSLIPALSASARKLNTRALSIESDKIIVGEWADDDDDSSNECTDD